MGKFGQVAISATNRILENRNLTPRSAWQAAAQSAFPDSASSRAKGCPRNAYLGLCEMGEIIGVPSGQYTNSQANKRYALMALELLRQNPELKTNKQLLWQKIMAGEQKQHNQQMDVVISLFDSGMTR